MNSLKNILKIAFVIFLFAGNFTIFAKPKIWIEYPDSPFGGRQDGVFVSSKGKLVSTGMFGTADVSELVSDDEGALEYARLSVEYSTSGKWWLWSGFILGLGGMLGSLAILRYDEDPLTKMPMKEPTQKSMQIFLGVFIASTVVYFGGFFVGGSKLAKSKHYLYKAINQYNGVYENHNTSLFYDNKTSSNYLAYNYNF